MSDIEARPATRIYPTAWLQFRDRERLAVVATEVVPPSIRYCACDRVAGLNPKPPPAVAARGLTPGHPVASKSWRSNEEGGCLPPSIGKRDNLRSNHSSGALRLPHDQTSRRPLSSKRGGAFLRQRRRRARPQTDGRPRAPDVAAGAPEGIPEAREGRRRHWPKRRRSQWKPFAAIVVGRSGPSVLQRRLPRGAKLLLKECLHPIPELPNHLP
jgi:hypothetical protein